MEDSQGNERLSNPAGTNESDGYQLFQTSDLPNQLATPETGPGAGGDKSPGVLDANMRYWVNQ